LIEQLCREKNVPEEVLVKALCDGMLAAARKFYKDGEDLQARYDAETGQVEIYAVLKVVEVVENPHTEISLTDARQYDVDVEVDDVMEMPKVELPNEKKTSPLGRIAAQTAKQVIMQILRELERKAIYTEYSDKVGDMVNGVIKRTEGRFEERADGPADYIVDIGKGIEAVLPIREQSRSERYKQGDRVRAVITRVHEVAKGPQVVLSRTDPRLIEHLFEIAIPEIYDGTIKVMSAVHEPGDRAKVAVMSMDRNVDPVGACVGMKGARINEIIRELRGEKIDIVQWSEDPAKYAEHALNPAKISKVIILDPVERRMEVIVEEKQQSLAIGKKGQNVRLASRLIGWQIDVKSEEQKRQEVQAAMDSFISSSTSLSEMEGVGDKVIAILRENGVENVETILDMGEDRLRELPEIGEKTAAKVMAAARDLFEEVEIEVPEGVDVPTAIAGDGAEYGAGAAAAARDEEAGESTDAGAAEADETVEAPEADEAGESDGGVAGAEEDADGDGGVSDAVPGEAADEAAADGGGEEKSDDASADEASAGGSEQPEA
jgi:N utilization substance protein A